MINGVIDMILISHRGYWLNPSEKNSMVAFKRSFSQGYGTETDIRDFNGELVISHDIPNERCMSFEDFMKLFILYDDNLPLALNIKSDGLSEKIFEYIKFYKIENYFCFDMSVPETIRYLDAGLNVFVRRSEYEVDNDLFVSSKGVWLDNFYQESLDEKNLMSYLESGKKVCIVSPELHRRDEKLMWANIRALSNSTYRSEQLMLCTDKLEKAGEVFYGQ
ncbi:hypothetical protein [Rosenbergiella collisarenosi]|uniref:hypothetical protein n=2 Tax=Rosenbergiella collisarenosi TaxID=1544695 RepID=UPI001F4F017C|nr:hypothetical protein [Rosenbergiella collisarenosi]